MSSSSGCRSTPTAPSVVCIVQARAGSTRLPGKVLRELDGVPMLAFLLERLRRFDAGPVVVATSSEPGDDEVATVATDAGVDVVRGPELDVLGRYAAALDRFPADHVVRITGDCPLTDPALVVEVLALHLAEGADYTSNIQPRTFPKGLDVEIAAVAALREADRTAAVPLEREHVMPYLYRHPEHFRLATHWAVERLGDEWWTVDTAEDMERIRALVAAVDRPREATWSAYLAAAGTTAPAGVRLVPTTLEGGRRAAAELGTPWGVELVGGGRRVRLGVRDAHAIARIDEPDPVVEEALVAMLASGVQVDSITFEGREPTIQWR